VRNSFYSVYGLKLAFLGSWAGWFTQSSYSLASEPLQNHAPASPVAPPVPLGRVARQRADQSLRARTRASNAAHQSAANAWPGGSRAPAHARERSQHGLLARDVPPRGRQG